MSRNRSLVQKLQDRNRRRTDTPRVDNFIATAPEPVFDEADFADHNAWVRAMLQMHHYVAGWTQFARTLEHDLMMSVPKEWKK